MNDAIESLSERFPTLEARLEGTRFAKNMTFCERSTPLSENDELALIPPVSGG